MSVRTVLIAINLITVVAIGVYLVLALRHVPEKTAANVSEPIEDDALEGRRLERVLGWSLVFAALIAVSLPLYWLREPDRQKESIAYFDDGSVERGATFFANAQSEAYDSTQSLQCADCHGSNGEGGAAAWTHTLPGEENPVRVSWAAPAIDTVLYRFSEEEVRDIIVYGRPGTPMQAWGVEGGGAKNDQAVDDLVAFIKSIQIPEADAQARTAKELAGAKEQAQAQLDSAKEAVTAAEEELAAVEADEEATEKEIEAAQKALTQARESLAWAEEWFARRQDVTDGQLLFEINCARCHTKNWSIYDPAQWSPEEFGLGAPGGGGTVGFNLRDGGSIRRFGEGAEGEESQLEFVTNGSEANKPYGIGGIGSGRMPGFAGQLTDEQIKAIVQYERDGIDQTDYSASAGEND